MLVIEPNRGRALKRWSEINWTGVERNVGRLQARIFRAAAAGDRAKVRSLQTLLARSTSAKLLAIRRVTQENAGRQTPGVDGVVCTTPRARQNLLNEGLALAGYRPRPVRRVHIPKLGGGLRPLGIPTIKDRVMQAIVRLALEAEWEARFEPNSFGFRPGRCTMDAIVALHTTLNKAGSSGYVLDADIAKCFDRIDHDALLARIPVFRSVVRRWLKAGAIQFGKWIEAPAGTPQGGVISPLLANIALDGMERLFGHQSRNGRPLHPSERRGPNRGVSLIRYADDFVVCAPSRAVLEDHVIPALRSFLGARGLQLSEAKTRITTVDEGFDFLGFQGRLLTRPSKDAILRHLRQIAATLRRHRQAPAKVLVRILNPVIRGWANYYRHGASSEVFRDVDHHVTRKLIYWARRRHPRKRMKWVIKRYFGHESGRWVFHEDGALLLRHWQTPISRHVKVRGSASPLDPTLRDYWRRRARDRMARLSETRTRQDLLRAQDGRCGLCRSVLHPGEPVEVHHRHGRSGRDCHRARNLMLVHDWCHKAHTVRDRRAAEA